MNDVNTPHQVAIIGAGMAGLACAQALQAQGIRSLIFEKSRGPSGRMSTRRTDQWQCDHGAQYFTVRDVAFQAEVDRWQAAGLAAPWHGNIAILPAHSGAGRNTQPVTRYLGVPHMTSPAHALYAGLDHTDQATVQSIRHDQGQWQITTAEHGLHPTGFDALVLAIPAPQAAKLLATQDSPLAALPAQAVMRGCWTLMLQYAAPIRMDFDAAFVNQGPISWLARNSSKPGRSGQECWVVQASPTWSEAHLEQEAAWVTTQLLEAAALLGLPAPVSSTVHRWRYADTENALSVQFGWDADKALGLCGDWLNGGRVEGAWTSGHALGAQVAAVLQRKAAR